MADPVASVEKIVKLGLAIKDAVDTVRNNEDECREIRKRVLRFSAILSQLQQTGMMSSNPTMRGALEDLEETLERALELVMACQERSTIRRLITAGDLSKQLRRVKDDILNKVMLASFAINAHATIVLLTIQAGHPLPQQPEVHRSWSEAPSAPSEALKKFSLSELKAAISCENIIGEGSSFQVYKAVLNDGNVVAVKKFITRAQYLPQSLHDQLLLASKLQHKNIVKVMGYGHEVQSKKKLQSYLARLLKNKNGGVNQNEYLWVEEYLPNGSLEKITHESRLDWSSLFRIIEGVAQGIHYLHEQHIVHMDVKRSNILLDSDMNPKITDFGLSIVLDDDEITQDSIIGTFTYMPPEFVMSGTLSMKNDVYAFGVTLLETISGICRYAPPDDDFSYELAWDCCAFRRIGTIAQPWQVFFRC